MLNTKNADNLNAAVLVALALSLSLPATAQIPPKPTLIVAISVDQFSADLFNEYRGVYAGGLKRLSDGVVFARGHQSHAATETCPGHSTLLTGSRPARTGVIANDWDVPTLPRITPDNKQTFRVYCAELPGPAGSETARSIISPHFLRVPTLGDRMKTADSRTRVVAISGKDRAAVMMGGHAADVTMWWNGKAFTTYANRSNTLPRGIEKLSVQANALIAAPALQPVPAQCQQRIRELPITSKVSVGTLKLRNAGDEARWRATPEFDSAILDAALTTLHELRLGQGITTDVLAISFSATDYVGHSYGTQGVEMCAQIVALDQTLAKLFVELDKLKLPYTVVLSADHGGHDLPERNDIRGLPQAERVDAALASGNVGANLARQFGLEQNALVNRSSFGDMYLSAGIAAEKRNAVLNAAVGFYRQHRQVAAVFTREELLAAPAPAGPVDEWSLLSRAKAGFDAERSGDFVVLLKPYVTPIVDPGSGYVATHGSPWGYDRRVPMLFWWPGIQGFEQPNAVETVDILPTLASFIGLAIPAGEIDGRCLDLLVGPESNCR